MKAFPDKFWLYLAAVLVVCVFVLYWLVGRHGHYPSDDGFILAYAWRAWNGELPYRDFVYLWTPLSIFVHQVWFLFPHDWSYSLARFGYLLQMALIVAIWAHWYFSFMPERRNIWTTLIFGSLLLLSVGNFPPMPWYTSDAVLAASLGAVCFLISSIQKVKRQLLWRSLGGAALLTAALFKQNFAALYILFTLLNLWLAKESLKVAVLSQVLSLFPLFTMGIWLRHHGLTQDFFFHVSRLSSGLAVVDAGLYAYLYHPVRYGTAFALGLTPVFLRKRKWNGFSAGALIAFLFFTAAETGIRHNLHLVLVSGTTLFWWCLGLLAGVLYRNRDERSHSFTAAAYHLFAFAIPWCASISYGWKTPWLGIGALAPFIASQVSRDLSLVRWRLANALIFLFAFLVTGLSVWRAPYWEKPRELQTWNLKEVYSVLGSLYTNEKTYQRYTDLKRLTQEMKDLGKKNIVVYPEFPLFYFLENRRNPLPLDWWAPVHYRGIQPQMESKLSLIRPVILLENLALYQGEELLTSWILQHSVPISDCRGSWCAYEITP